MGEKLPDCYVTEPSIITLSPEFYVSRSVPLASYELARLCSTICTGNILVTTGNAKLAVFHTFQPAPPLSHLMENIVTPNQSGRVPMLPETYLSGDL